jgi:hypothetical protein
MQNGDILDRTTKHNILSLIIMNDCASAARDVGKKRAVDINLDEVHKINPELITRIYNIVKTRRELLNQPAII